MSGGGLILLYHRVNVLERDPQLLCVAPLRFDEQMRVLRDHWTPMTVPDLVRCAANDAMPDRAVAVTFDDGYADNLEMAAPRLLEHGIPATFFICADPLGDACEFWWDELERIALASDRLSDTLEVAINGHALRWRSTTCDGDAAAARGHDPAPRDWNVLRQNAETDRTRLYRQLFAWLLPLPLSQRRDALQALRGWAGTPAAPRDTHRRLNPDDLVKLAAMSGMEIGGHTVSHPRLAALNDDAQYMEIRDNQAYLAEVLDRPIRGFSYPFGARMDYDAQTVTQVRRCEFAWACANRPGRVTAGASPFELPRFVVRDWAADAFARQLERWQRRER